MRIQPVVTFFIILFLFFSSLSSAQSISSSDEVGWDKFYGLQPSDMDGHPASRLYQWAIVMNIIEGYPDNTLKPDRPVTEAEFLKMLYRGFGIAIPTQVFPPGYDASSYDWTDSPYRMAKMFNHPALGLSNPELRSAPITRLQAAEIVSAAQGVHYTGDQAVTYIIGNNLAIHHPLTIEEFRPDHTMTRTEAVQWIRHLTLQGMMKIKQRPADPTDPSLLPDLSVNDAEAIPLFSSVSLSSRGLDLLGTQSFPRVEFGASKSSIDPLFGVSEEKDIFDKYIYPLFSAHYNEDGRLDGWSAEHKYWEPATTGPMVKTNEDIVLGESTLFDVLRKYGTYGYKGEGIANYLYEKTKDGEFRPLTSVSYYSQIENPDNAYSLSFIFDEDTLRVSHILAAWAPYSYSGNM